MLSVLQARKASGSIYFVVICSVVCGAGKAVGESCDPPVLCGDRMQCVSELSANGSTVRLCRCDIGFVPRDDGSCGKCRAV